MTNKKLVVCWFCAVVYGSIFFDFSKVNASIYTVSDKGSSFTDSLEECQCDFSFTYKGDTYNKCFYFDEFFLPIQKQTGVWGAAAPQQEKLRGRRREGPGLLQNYINRYKT